MHFLFKGVDFINGFVLKYVKTQISFFSNLQVSRLFQGRFTTKRKFCGSRSLGGRETNLGGGPSLRQAMVPGKRGKICEKEDPKMKKRTLSILLSLCLAVTLVTPAVAAEPASTEATEVNGTLELTEATTGVLQTKVKP